MSAANSEPGPQSSLTPETGAGPEGAAAPVEIPVESLTPEALLGVIDNFILREGTDYGSVEHSYTAKIDKIKKQLQDEEIKIIFDLESESVTLITAVEFKKLMRKVKNVDL